MMNKNDYISAVDKITAPETLKEKIKKENKQTSKSGRSYMKFVAAAAACLVVFVGVFSVLGNANMGAKSADSANNEAYQYTADEMVTESAEFSESKSKSTVSTMSKTESERKIIKNAELYVETKDYGKFIDSLDKKIEAFSGYTDRFEENNYSDKNAVIVVRIPSDSLEKFLSGVNEIGTVQSKTISKSDVTESYIDIESHITALETEEQALLKILGSCTTVTDTIEVQSRLSEVRAEKESYVRQQKSLDSRVSYSTVTINISEAEHIVTGGDTFSAKLKEKFNDSLYNIGSFFENLALNFLGGILYILIIAAVAAVVIIIIRKKRKNRI